ncbi:DUF4365 domain-containing protein [Actinomadura parmotrematis]|uniref:DUF4365 domain-containing protein n=1 Tax=Actinomadura parmotrematis TaxID=2864039 RepID=A0ABS7FUG8_9ACTN|nr:DUF4365 domain-containing protein [Actinomadura parmotrematis]MBW8484056.1 DUF4365 domain-containing protein [Actinomadura parmotrematis]
MLEHRNHQGKFAEDYVRVLASAAGLVVQKEDIDVDGIDLGLRYPGRVGGLSFPAIEVQVKSWSAPRVVDGELRYGGLNEVQYNHLAAGPFTVPRFLFLVLVPRERDAYARFETDGMMLRQLGYYRGFEGEQGIGDPSNRRRRAVRVPLGNVLTARTLLSLVRAATGAPAPTA